MANGELVGEVMTREQDKMLAQGMLYTQSNITSISFPFVVPFVAFYKPTTPPNAPVWVTQYNDGII